MINLGSETITQAQVNAQVDTALTDYAASTIVQVGNLNSVSQAQVRAQVNAGNVAYDAFTGEEAVILNDKIDVIDAEVEIVDAELDIVEVHLHSREHWCGKSGDQSGNDWGADTLTPYQAISGNDVYGADANDEAKVIGSDDTPFVVGNLYFDMHRITVVEISSDTVYKLRVVWGTGTMAAAILANQTTEMLLITSTDKANKFGGAPFAIQTLRVAVGTKIWIQAWNASDNATVDFFVGLHEYSE